MLNSDFSTQQVKNVCERKLNIVFRCNKECNGWFEYEGKKISRITVPKGRKPIPAKTYKSMAKQLKLSVEDMDNLLACPLNLEKYLAILESQGLLPK